MIPSMHSGPSFRGLLSRRVDRPHLHLLCRRMPAGRITATACVGAKLYRGFRPRSRTSAKISTSSAGGVRRVKRPRMPIAYRTSSGRTYGASIRQASSAIPLARSKQCLPRSGVGPSRVMRATPGRRPGSSRHRRSALRERRLLNRNPGLEADSNSEPRFRRLGCTALAKQCPLFPAFRD